MRRGIFGGAVFAGLLALSCSEDRLGAEDCPKRDFVDYGVGVERELAIPIVEAERAVFRVCVDWECSSLKPMQGRLELDEGGGPHFTGRISGTAKGTYFESVVNIGTRPPGYRSHVSIEMTPERSDAILLAKGEIPWTSNICNPLPVVTSL